MKLKKAIEFATKAHEGQVRKYTGEPYIVHPLEVAEIVKTVEHTEEMLMAAVLHDTVEDTDTTIEDIDRENESADVKFDSFNPRLLEVSVSL